MRETTVTGNVRSFGTVCEEICNALPKNDADKLESSACYWAPEIAWRRLSEFVNANVIPSSKDENSVKIYAILCNESEEEMRKRFEEQGL